MAASWDATSPPILFADLVAAWQWAIWRYHHGLREGMDRADAWQRARPTTFRGPLDGAGEMGRALMELGR